LVKFAKPTAGMARVTMAVDLTDDWLTEKRQLVFAQILKVTTAERPGSLE
jgi:hypothetical protein